MAKIHLLPPVGEYKANLHGHTTFSDGRLTPEEFAHIYRQAGYSVICITDHRRYHWHRQLCAEGFVCLAGFEADINSPADGPNRLSRTEKCYHINFYDALPHTRGEGYAPPVVPTERQRDIAYINAWLRSMSQAGFLACYNHPYWSLQDYRDYAGLKGLFAMEIYNHNCQQEGLHGYAPRAYDEMLRAGQQLCCLATDDNHNALSLENPLNDSFGGFTLLRMPALSYENTIAALMQGDLYASTGPRIDELYVEDGGLHIRCGPVDKICVLTDGRDAQIAAAPVGGCLEGADFALTGRENWLRVDCQSHDGRHAYTRAYYRDELGR